ncbi:hypothetical protein D3C76_866170 [compost metagenome]
MPLENKSNNQYRKCSCIHREIFFIPNVIKQMLLVKKYPQQFTKLRIIKPTFLINPFVECGINQFITQYRLGISYMLKHQLHIILYVLSTSKLVVILFDSLQIYHQLFSTINQFIHPFIHCVSTYPNILIYVLFFDNRVFKINFNKFYH